MSAAAPTAVLGAAALVSADAARAQVAHSVEGALGVDLVGVAVSGGLALFSALVAVTHIAERKRWRRRETDLALQLEEARAEAHRARVFLGSEQQTFFAWDGPASEADIVGAALIFGDGAVPARALAFGTWLAPAAAQALEAKIDRLRRRGEGFRLALEGLNNRHFDAEGRAVGGRAVVRLREVTGAQRELIGLRERFAEKTAEIDGLLAMLDAAPAPIWLRDRDGRITFVNTAYARAVEAESPADAVGRQLELLDQGARGAALEANRAAAEWRQRVTAIVAGERHAMDVIQTPAKNFSAAVAVDRHEIDKVRADLERQMEAHVRTLDQLPTAVAIFDRAQRLVYHNAAYDKLWPLDAAFLAQQPTDPEILDRLRAAQRLPAEADYKVWKERLLEAYRSPEQHEHVWHMPNARALRVVVRPNPQGGVTYLYDDISERYDLESRFNALYRMQHETLETLHEGVAVFGTDGRLRFCNPAFLKLWRLTPELVAEKPRFEEIANACEKLHGDAASWAELKVFVTGLPDMRTGFTRRMERGDGVVLDCTAQPLPEGAALLTFVDVTNDVSVERALTERNTALLAAEKLRNDFTHHVSYELRSPLNNINGFVHLLGEATTGPLNAKQREYLSYVRKSSDALLAIIDDILDLATIDEDAMSLDLEEVDAEAAMRAALEGVQDRLAENNVDLQIVVTGDVGAFPGDAKRVRQILFNLLSNAIGFSSPGQTVMLAAMRRENEVVFKVIDRGRGIPPDVLERVFERFESHTAGTRHRGVGLGLSIVRAFMELHGGRVLIDSAPGEGTTVTCIFPAQAASGAQSKERAS